MSTLASVLTTRAPDAPSGWPIAIAPPRVLTRSGSTCQASMHARDWTANASFSSTAPTSDHPMPAAAKARSAASTGAIPKRCGSRAAAPRPAIRATGVDAETGVRSRDDQGGRAVVERGRVSGGDRAVGSERRLEPCQALRAGLGPDPLVAIEPVHRQHEVVVEPVGPGLRRTLVRDDGER